VRRNLLEAALDDIGREQVVARSGEWLGKALDAANSK